MTAVGNRIVGPTAGPAVPARAGWRDRLSPSLRDGLALVLSNGLTSAVGLGYWVLAARLFSPSAVGVNNVALSTMMLLGGVAQLNMTYALLRFVPVAGRATRRLVIGGYLVGAAAAALVGAAFALGADLWAGELVEAVGRWQLVVFFTVAAPLWAIFVIQDFVLTGIRRASIVPAENFVFSLLKIGLLVVAAAFAVPGGIAVSWVVSTALIVIGINAWLLLRGLPRHAREAADRAVPITLGGIARFVRADYAGAVFWQTAQFGLPVLVLARLGPVAAGIYGIVWTIGQALYTVASSMGQSMVAHSSAADPSEVEAARRAMVRRAMVIVGPVVVVLVVGAPLVLSVFGSRYAEAGSLLLVLVALSAVPNVLTASTVNAARVRQRMGVLFGVPATISIIVLVLSWLLMPRLGVVGVGVAWIVGQSVVAAGILVATAPWLPPLLWTRIDGLRSAALLRRVRPLAATQAYAGWVLGTRMTGASDSVVVRFGPDDPETTEGALLKASDSHQGQAQLRRQAEVLRALQADDRLGHLRALVPTLLGDGEIGGSYYVLESRLAGNSGRALLRDPQRLRAYRSSGVATISEIHRRTATLIPVGEDELRRWVYEPMALVLSALPRGHRAAGRALAETLAGRLRGTTVAAAWFHGDYTIDNVLSDEEGRTTAIVDWCDGDPGGFAVLDVVSFLLAVENAFHGEEFGALVLGCLTDARRLEGDLLARVQRSLGSDVLDVGLLVVMGWLQHVSHNIAKSPQFAANPVWVRRNLVAVVRDARLT